LNTNPHLKQIAKCLLKELSCILKVGCASTINYQLTKEEYYLVLMEKMPSKKFCRCTKSKKLARIHQQVLQDASRTATDLNHTDID
jgi:hypothetical protein